MVGCVEGSEMVGLLLRDDKCTSHLIDTPGELDWDPTW